MTTSPTPRFVCIFSPREIRVKTIRYRPKLGVTVENCAGGSLNDQTRCRLVAPPAPSAPGVPLPHCLVTLRAGKR